MSLSRGMLALVCVLAGSRPASGQAPSQKMPETPAGRAFQQWLNAYNAADSVSLMAYAREHEPGMNIALNIAGRGVSGGLDVQSIEASEPRHLELVLKSRTTHLTVYGVVDVGTTQPARTSTALAIVGDPFDRAALRIDAAERALVIDSLAAKISRNYVFPDVGKRIADSLEARKTRGAYDLVTNQVALAQQLMDELLELSHDKHIAVRFVPVVLRGPSPTPTPAPPPARAPAPSPSPSPSASPAMMRPPCGYEGKVLDGNVGYVTFSNFRDPEECGANASQAMNAIAGTRAVIIDLRLNGGGSPQMVAYLASYLFAHRTHLNDSWTRATGITEEWWTRDDVPGPRFGETKPVYVLTSTLTISAAEEFAYDLQSLKRAVIVGESTAGAAHLTASGQIGAHLMIAVPIARPINPITKTDWESVGVIPDVQVPARDALMAAEKLIRSKLGEQGAAAPATPAIPRTAAGDEFRAWLDTYNSGDSAQADAYFRSHLPDQAARGMFYFRPMTGGLDLLTIERSEPQHLEFMVRFRKGPMVGYGSLDVTSAAPARIAKFTIDPLGEAESLAAIRIDAGERAAVVGRTAKLMDSLYVFPDVAKQVGDSIRARLAHGAYDSYTNGAGFAMRLDNDVTAIAHDKHLKIRYSMRSLPPQQVERTAPVVPTAGEIAQFTQQMAEHNCGFSKAEQLAGNIGYLKVDTFTGADVCGPTVSAAMTFVAGTRGLILDLRDNGGGQPGMVSLVASYLFDGRTHLGDLWTRHAASTQEIWTQDSVPPKRFGGQRPIYILTSARTFSAAEEFAYDLQVLKRAVIVGGTTGGGAHPVHDQRIDDHFMIGVPFARSINPMTHANWEGVGVEPDVKVAESEALATAQRLLRERTAPPRVLRNPEL